MAIAVEMPKMSDTMEEGVLVAWLAEEGASVSAGDVIAQVETDKATMDLEVYDDGVLLKRVVGEGDSVPIGALIAVLGSVGESPDDVLGSYGGDGASKAADEAAPSAMETSEVASSQGDGAAAVAAVAPVTVPSDGGRVKASPLARRMAQEGGVDLASLSGSGPDGRVVKRDVEAALGGTAPAPTAQPVAVPTAQPVAPAVSRQPVVAGRADRTRVAGAHAAHWSARARRCQCGDAGVCPSSTARVIRSSEEWPPQSPGSVPPYPTAGAEASEEALRQ